VILPPLVFPEEVNGSSQAVSSTGEENSIRHIKLAKIDFKLNPT